VFFIAAFACLSAHAQLATRMPTGPAGAPKSATITVSVPPGAELWFDNYKPSQTGTTRSFVTPPLAQDQQFSYRLRMRWAGGQWSGRLSIRAGQDKNIELPPRQSTRTPGEADAPASDAQQPSGN
jgi:uncharacterized protein (TIGR03000 family)